MFHTSWPVTTIKNIIKNPVKDLLLPFCTFKRTQEAAVHNSSILSSFGGKLGESIEAQKGIPLDCGSEFRDITGILKLFSHHEDKYIIVNIIQKGSRYHLSPIEEATRKSVLEAMLLRGCHKSEKSCLNMAALEKAMYKEVEHRWVFLLTMDSIGHIKTQESCRLGYQTSYQ